jgi:hypothetical protein
VVERLFRVENLVVIPLLIVAVLVALGARWRDDSRPGRAAAGRVMLMTVRLGFAFLVIGIALFFVLLLVRPPVGP